MIETSWQLQHMDATKLPLKRMKPAAAEFLVAGKSESPSAADVAAVVEHARQRGIRVVPEVRIHI